ncbi:hypothetical protein [Antarcticirhabdus aurantiaca]|uniref:Uncharacterized protein n=2 Tax=Antarcticirhabdus aurantiaca TaxID=2606717 RepID=A0ACD4NVG2_9HYPH|nr:hypothetical protein OXU80_12220 [Jeongeuplla avenae]
MKTASDAAMIVIFQSYDGAVAKMQQASIPIVGAAGRIPHVFVSIRTMQSRSSASQHANARALVFGKLPIKGSKSPWF